MIPADLRQRLRLLVWSAPVLAAWQAGCTTISDSCDDFESRRVSRSVPFEAGASDAGPPSTSEECRRFCQAHAGSDNNDLACHTASADGGLVVVCEFNTVCEGRRPAGYQPPCDDTAAPLLAATSRGWRPSKPRAFSCSSSWPKR